jgi:hypothetical protein
MEGRAIREQDLADGDLLSFETLEGLNRGDDVEVFDLSVDEEKLALLQRLASGVDLIHHPIQQVDLVVFANQGILDLAQGHDEPLVEESKTFTKNRSPAIDLRPASARVEEGLDQAAGRVPDQVVAQSRYGSGLETARCGDTNGGKGVGDGCGDLAIRDRDSRERGTKIRASIEKIPR